MSRKALSALCVVVALAHSSLGQFLGPCSLANNALGLGYASLAENGLGCAGLGYNGMIGSGLGYGGLIGAGVASTGGGLPVACASSIAPVGISVLSENAYEGSVSVGGSLPFLGTVGLEGVMPTAGAGAVSYGCGNGATGIAMEEGLATGIAGIGPYGSRIGSIGAYGPGLSGIGMYGTAFDGIGPYGLGYDGCSAGFADYGPYGFSGCGALY